VLTIDKELIFMTGLVPFNRRGMVPTRIGAGFEDFYNMLDDFFTDGTPANRNLFKDTFKVDIIEQDRDYLIEAELPGIQKSEISLDIQEDTLVLSVNRQEETNTEGKSYIHRERRLGSVCRRIRLADAKLEDIKAKLENGILTVTVPKSIKDNAPRKIDIE